MYKFIFSYKHSLGPYFNLITSINDKGIVEYEYSYCPDFIYNSDKFEYYKDTLNKDLSKQFIEYIEKAQIYKMEESYIRMERILDNAPNCNFALIKDSDSCFISVEADSYPDTFKYIVKALDLISSDFIYWYKFIEGNLN